MGHPGADAAVGPMGARADVRDMAIVHQFFRREFALAPRILLDLREEQRDRRAALGEWLDIVTVGMHHHHEGEDAHVFPLLAERAGRPELIATMASQHTALAAATDAIEERLADWRADSGPTTTAALVAAYEQLLPVLVGHLDQEESEVVPLIARHLTAEEYGLSAKSGNGRFDDRTLLLSFGAMVEQASEQDGRWMISHLTDDVQQLWYGSMQQEYRALMALLRNGLEPVPAQPSAARPPGQAARKI